MNENVTSRAEGVTVGELARLFRCTERAIQLLAKSGTVVKLEPGRYDKDESVGADIVHLRQAAAGRGPGRTDGSLSPIDALRIEQRLLVEAKRRVLTSDLVPRDEIAPAWARVVRAVRSAMLAVPGRARFALPHLTVHDGEVLAEIVRDQLEAAALADKPPQVEGVADADTEDE